MLKQLSLIFCSTIFMMMLLASTIHAQEPTAENIELVGQIGGTTQAVFVQGNYAYIGEGPRLTVLDISNPATPRVRGRSAPLPDDIQDIYMQGDYLYVTTSDITYRNSALWIFRKSDYPYLVAKYDNLDYAYTVYVSSNYAYIADDNDGLHIVDISDPVYPTHVGTYDSDGQVQKVQVRGNYAYIADGSKGLKVVDVSNPAQPTEKGHYNISGQVNDVQVIGNYAYLTGSDLGGLRVVDISTPSNPTEIGFYSSAKIGNKLFIYNNRAYFSNDTGNQFLVLDVSTPSNPTQLGSYDLLNGGADIYVIDNYAYLANGSDGGLQILNISNPTNITQTGAYIGLSSINDVAVVGNYAYVVSPKHGLQIVDVRNPYNPTTSASFNELLGQLDTPGTADAIKVVNNYAYVADGSQGLRIIDIRNPQAPYEAKYYGQTISTIAISDSYAYLGTGRNMEIADISNPISPTVIGNYIGSKGCTLKIIQLQHKYAYMGYHCFKDNVTVMSLQIVDISNPNTPVLIGTYETTGWVYGMTIMSDYAYLTTSDKLQVLNVSNPQNPTLVSSYSGTYFSSGITANNNYIYALSFPNLQRFDVSNPSQLKQVGHYPLYGNNLVINQENIYVAAIGGLSILRDSDMTPTLQLTPTSLTFQAAENEKPSDQYFSISSDNVGIVHWTINEDIDWLRLRQTAGSNLYIVDSYTATLRPSGGAVSIDTIGLAAGTYTGLITVNALTIPNSPQTLTVTLTIKPLWQDEFWNGTKLSKLSGIEAQYQSLHLAAKSSGTWEQTSTTDFISGEFYQTEAKGDTVQLSLNGTSNEYFTTGIYTSTVYDAGQVVDWSSARWNWSGSGKITVETRSGITNVPNENNWSGWTGLSAGGICVGDRRKATNHQPRGCSYWDSLISSNNQYIQYRLLFDSRGDNNSKVELFDITLSYRTYTNNGIATSVPITPNNLIQWGKIHYTATVPAPTRLTVDVLATDDTVLMSNVQSGASLASINPTQHPAIKLRASMATTDAAYTPEIELWGVTWNEDIGPQLQANPTSLTFQAEPGGANLITQTISLSHIGANALVWSASGGENWLQVSPASGNSPALLSVSVNTTGLSKGSYQTNLVISSMEANNSPLTIPIYLTLGDISDPYEPNNRCEQAQFIPTDGRVQEHSFQAQEDVDWVSFQATSGTLYLIEARVPADSAADIVMELYDHCGGDSDLNDSFNQNIKLQFTAPTSGLYVMKLKNKQATTYGSQVRYHLSIRKISSEPVPGALVLVAGKLYEQDPRQRNIHKTAKQLYKTFLQQGYTADRIFLLATDSTIDFDDNPTTQDVDALASQERLKYALTQWATNPTLQLGPERGLTLYMLDHGDYDKFYLDTSQETVTSNQVDNWLDTFEAARPGTRVNVVIDACLSGSFINPSNGTLSQAGRVIIASTSNVNNAYTSREGGMSFSDIFIQAIGSQKSLYASFNEAEESANIWRNDQQAWLDDNGDGFVTAADGAVAQQRGFAFAGSMNAGELYPPYIEWVVGPNSIDNRRGEISAKVLDDVPNSTLNVWAVIYDPSYKTPEVSQYLVSEDNLPTIRLEDPDNDHVYTATYPGFDQHGKYRLVIYATDDRALQAQPKQLTFSTNMPVYLPMLVK